MAKIRLTSEKQQIKIKQISLFFTVISYPFFLDCPSSVFWFSENSTLQKSKNAHLFPEIFIAD